MYGDYEFIKYEVDGNGIATITLNRPEKMNAFNRKMSGELIFALDRFDRGEEERVLVITGAGRAFSTGEDLANINLDASDLQMREYAEEALGDYHNIVRATLLIGKPIITMLNGVAAGAGMSIALACDYRLTGRYDTIFVPAFTDMGLVPDSGMAAILPRLAGRKEAQRLCEARGVKISTEEAIQLNLLEVTDPMELARSFVGGSSAAFAFSKELRNKALLYKLNKRVFPWEMRAQTACLQSDYFKERARAFLAKQKAREAK